MAYPKSTALLILPLFSSFPPLFLVELVAPVDLVAPLSSPLSRSLSLSLSLPLCFSLAPSFPSLSFSHSLSLSPSFPLAFSLIPSLFLSRLLSLFVSRTLSFSHATNRLIEFYSQTRRLESACGVRERENERTRERKKCSLRNYGLPRIHSLPALLIQLFFSPPLSSPFRLPSPPSLFLVPSPFPSLFLSRFLSIFLSFFFFLSLSFLFSLFFFTRSSKVESDLAAAREVSLPAAAFESCYTSSYIPRTPPFPLPKHFKTGTRC